MNQNSRSFQGGRRIFLWPFFIILAIGILSPNLSQAETVTPPLLADAFVYSGSPNGNYPNGYLWVQDQTGWYEARTYLKFNVTAIPDNAAITSAQLYLWDNSNAQTPININLHSTSDAWLEAGAGSITFNNQPWAPPGTANYLSTTAISTTGWVSFNLLTSGKWDYAQDLADNSVSLVLVAANESTVYGGAQFKGEEDGLNPPRLEVTYQVVPLPPTVLLLGSGLAGLALLGARRRRGEINNPTTSGTNGKET